MPHLRRLAALLAFALILSAGSLEAADRSSAQIFSPSHLLSQLWSFFGAESCDKGILIDPDGRCATATAPIDPEAAATRTAAQGRVLIDPDGSTQTFCDKGILIDPNGGGCSQ
jgi:hypothetical protein